MVVVMLIIVVVVAVIIVLESNDQKLISNIDIVYILRPSLRVRDGASFFYIILLLGAL